MKHLKLFEQFLNEGQSFNEVKILEPGQFPWEGPMIEKIATFNKTVKFLADEYNYNQHRRSYPNGNAFELNIKIHDFPDFEELAEKHGMSEEEVSSKWETYTEMVFNDFISNNLYDYGWIADVFSVGRNGGWMALTLEKYQDLESFVERVEQSLYDYNEEVKDFSKVTKDEYEKLKTTISAKRIGLLDSNLEKANEVTEALLIFEKYMSEINLDVDDLLKIEKDLKDISEEVDHEIEHFSSGFEGFIAED
jgi:hypothetical protein